jgi:hypothetical protein
MARKYSDKDKATALAALDANGGNAAKTARETKIPRATIQEWANGRVSDDVPEIRHETKRELIDMFRDELYEIFAELPHKRGDATYAQLATAAGIFNDKVQLLSGGATSRADVRLSNLPPLPDDQLDNIFSD